MNKEKHIKINKPMPEAIKKALKEKQEWKEKVQSGEIQLKLKACWISNNWIYESLKMYSTR